MFKSDFTHFPLEKSSELHTKDLPTVRHLYSNSIKKPTKEFPTRIFLISASDIMMSLLGGIQTAPTYGDVHGSPPLESASQAAPLGD